MQQIIVWVIIALIGIAAYTACRETYHRKARRRRRLRILRDRYF